MEDIISNFNSDEEDNDEIVEPLSIKKEEFENLKIIGQLQSCGILKNTFNCPICSKKMKLESNKQYIDRYVWRCRVTNPLHDIKKNIRSDSIFESIKIPINVVYYLTFKCFINHYSLNKTYNDNMSFCNLMKAPITTKNTIVELFRILRNSIRKYYHKKWNETMLGMEPDEGGVGRIEIDESELIGRENQIL